MTRADWVALYLAIFCLTPYGCKDSASESHEVLVPLVSLSVLPGTLQPAFSSNTTDYHIDAPTAATSVAVTAGPRDSTTTMTINGVETPAGQSRSVSLGLPGSTVTISIALSSQTGSESTYTVTVTRLLSSDNNLSALTVTPGLLSPAFAPDQPAYTVDVATSISSVTIAATKSDPEAILSGDVSDEGRATIQLDGPGTSRAVPIIVTAPNGESRTYRITINRAASGNNNLSALSVTPGPLSPAFAAGTLNYQVDVGPKVGSVTVVATKVDSNAVISGDLPNEGQATVQLNGPGNPTSISITVTAQNGTGKTYTITVNRAAPSSNNNLSALSVTSGVLSPAFTAEQLAYAVDVPTTVGSVDVSATKADPDAVLSGSVTAGTGVAIGQATVPLSGPGSPTQVSMTVTAPSGASKSYSITINRRASDDSTLSSLSVSAGTMDPPFAAQIQNYSVKVGLLVGSVTITATKTDPNAIMSALGSVIAAGGTPAGSVTVSPGIGPNPPVEIIVTAQDRIKTTTYTVVVTRGLF